MAFPGALGRTVAVWRNVTSTAADGYNLQAISEQIYTGVDLNLRSLNSIVDSDGAGRVSQSQYRASCAKSNDIQVGDLLKDENENGADGNPVTYEVSGATRYFAYIKLSLVKTTAV